MESYRTLYRIAVEHSYFNGGACSALQCSLAPQGTSVARQRGLLFRQAAANAWEVIFDSLGAGPDRECDVLALEIRIIDPSFALYTEWPNFRPAVVHLLYLPVADEIVDVDAAICHSDKKFKIGMPFCTIHLRLTKELLEAATAGKPKQALLRFYAPEAKWEYLFLPRSETSTFLGRLSLEDTTEKLKFIPFEPCDVYGKIGWRTVSLKNIPMRMAYESRLRLVAQNGDKQQKCILLSLVPPPEPGRFQSEQIGMIRHVCYY